jgi:hypothetical protein
MIIHNSFNSKNPKEPCPVQSMQNFHEKKQYVAGKFTDGEMRSLPFRMEMIIVGGVSNQDTRRANHFPSFQDVCRVKDPVKGVAQTIQVTALSVPLVDRSLDDRVRACLHSCVCMCMCPYRARASTPLQVYRSRHALEAQCAQTSPCDHRLILQASYACRSLAMSVATFGCAHARTLANLRIANNNSNYNKNNSGGVFPLLASRLAYMRCPIGALDAVRHRIKYRFLPSCI